jgi:hypothetical protein
MEGWQLVTIGLAVALLVCFGVVAARDTALRRWLRDKRRA